MAHYLKLDGEIISESEYCRRKGFNYGTVKTRMKSHNETLEQAIQYYEENGVKSCNAHINLIECDGEMVSAKEYCRRKGISYDAVRNRVRKYEETYKQAINYYTKNGVKFQRQKGIIKDLRFYKIWRGMVDRCINKNHKYFKKYSKLGIQESWLDFENFQNDMYEEYLECLSDTNDLPSIDRKNNDIGYFKDNYHWIPQSKQARNKNNNIWANEDELLIEYCEHKGLRYNIIHGRIKMGYTLEEAESMPIPEYTGKYLKYIGKNIREFNILKLKDTVPSYAIAKCNICNAEIKFCIPDVLNHKPNKGCSCRKGHKFYIGNNNYTYKELETLYNLSHEEMKNIIKSGNNEFFKDIENLSYDEWINLLKDIHSKW